MYQYKKLINDIITNGENVSDRTGVGTRSIFGYQMKFNLADGFPAVTVKKLAWKSVVGELLWFLEGSTDERLINHEKSLLAGILSGLLTLTNKVKILVTKIKICTKALAQFMAFNGANFAVKVLENREQIKSNG